MSASTTSDPLVVNTQDGVVWMRRAVTREGRGLYAVADAPKCCPEFVMATLAELAEHGIAGMADALPMPVGPVLRSELDQARDDVMGACLARWEEEQDNARLRLALASAKRGRSKLRARVAELEAHATQFRVDTADGEHALVIRRSTRDMYAVIEAEAQGRRKAWTRQGWRIAAVLADSDVFCWPDAATALAEARRLVGEGTEVSGPTPAELADRLTALFAPTQALREDPHDGPLHHSYRVSRELPESGGVS